MTKLTTDEVNVLMDALAALRSDIGSHVQGWDAPWDGYHLEDEEAPLANEQGYMRVLHRVAAKLDDYLSSATDKETTS